MDNKGKRALGVGIAVAAIVGVGAAIHAAQKPEEVIPPDGALGVGASIGITLLGPSGQPVYLTAPLSEGVNYTLKVTVKNSSTKGGVAWATPLQISVFAGTGSATFVPSQISSQSFAAGETKVFTFPMNIPIGTGGQTGNIVARVFSPVDTALAAALASIVDPFTIGTVAIDYGATISVGV